jgi:hypothetical protein
MRVTEGRASVRRGGRCPEVQPVHKERLGMLVGRGVEEGISAGGIEEGEVDGRSEARDASENW